MIPMSQQHHHHQQNVKNLKIAFLLNSSFAIVEFIGGLLTNSTAILADAVHDLGDSFALAQAWYFESLSKKKSTLTYTYGYRRFKLAGALVSALLLVVSSLYVLSEAIPRILAPEASHAPGMIGLAVLGIVVNGFAIFRLNKGQGINVQLVSLHLLEDVLGWAAILVVGIILLFFEIHILDPILAVLITLYILTQLTTQLKTIVPFFLQAAPQNIDLTEVETRLKDIEHVRSLHHLHIWSLDGEHSVLTAHIVSERILNAQEYAVLKQRLDDAVHELGLSHSTLEIEWPDEACRIREQELCQ